MHLDTQFGVTIPKVEELVFLYVFILSQYGGSKCFELHQDCPLGCEGSQNQAAGFGLWSTFSHVKWECFLSSVNELSI